MSTRTTWQPPHGDADANHDHRLDTHERDALPPTAFALPEQRKLPLTDAGHVRNALARFDQVTDVTDADRELAFANIRKAAEHFGVPMTETRWQDLGRHPHTPNPSHGSH